MSEAAGARSRPLGGKAYGSIPHLPGSRTGPADRHISEGLARVCTERARDDKDYILVLEKLDGSCVAAARIGDEIIALGRDGMRASRSPNEARRLFAAWVGRERDRFLAALRPGERLVGEWLALAHGTRYALRHEPFVAFDLMRGGERAPFHEVLARCEAGGFTTPGLVHSGGPLSTAEAMARLDGGGFHGALDPVEGAVYRVERRSVGEPREPRESRVDFLAKYVRPGKIDGCFLPEVTGRDAVWNIPWRT